MKKTLTLLLALLMILSLAACSSKPAETKTDTPAGTTEKTETKNEAPAAKRADLVIAAATEAVTLDPQGGWDGASLYILRQLYNGLVKLDNDMNVVGDLAESWEFTTDKTVTFKLKQGVKFHNGEELKASDVVFSIQRAQASAKVKSFTANIESVVADDDYTVTITTSIPYAPLMTNLCHTANCIVSQKAVEAAGDTFSSAPIGGGTGPFVFKSWDSGDKIVLTRNDDYFASEVKATSLTYKLMSEDAARAIALETGEVDLVLVLSGADAKRIDANPDTVLNVSMSPKIEYVSFNQHVEPFNNPLVRQAINCAINREELCLVATDGYGTVTDSVMNSQIKGYTDQVTHYEFNLEKAKELLTQAGYPNGFNTSIQVGTNARNLEAQQIQGTLTELGFQVEINQLESAANLEKINNGDYDMFIMSYNNTTGDPDTSMYMLFNSKVPASSGNRSYTNIARVDELLEAGRAEIDNEKRMAIYAEIQAILTEQAVWVPLYNVPTLVGTRTGLKGYDAHPLGADVFDQLGY